MTRNRILIMVIVGVGALIGAIVVLRTRAASRAEAQRGQMVVDARRSEAVGASAGVKQADSGEADLRRSPEETVRGDAKSEGETTVETAGSDAMEGKRRHRAVEAPEEESEGQEGGKTVREKKPSEEAAESAQEEKADRRSEASGQENRRDGGAEGTSRQQWQEVVERSFDAQESRIPREELGNWRKLRAAVMETINEAEGERLTRERLEQFRTDLPALLSDMSLALGQGQAPKQVSRLGKYTRTMFQWQVRRFLTKPLPKQAEIEKLMQQVDGLYEVAAKSAAEEDAELAKALAKEWPERRAMVKSQIESALSLTRKEPLSEKEQQRIARDVKSACVQGMERFERRDVPKVHRASILRMVALRMLFEIQGAVLRPRELEMPEGVREEAERAAREHAKHMRNGPNSQQE